MNPTPDTMPTWQEALILVPLVTGLVLFIMWMALQAAQAEWRL